MKEKKFAARNLSMLIDFYELTMANGYFQSGRKDTVAVFDMFFRKIPDNGGFAIFAGLEQLIDYMRRTLPTCGAGESSVRSSWTIWQTSILNAMYGRYPRAHRSFPTNLW